MRTTKELFDLTGRTALVTGGSRGLGLQIAEALGELGAKIVLSSRKQSDLDEAVAHLKTRGIEASAIAADLSQESSVEPLVEEALKRLGHIDILVNNAGATWGAPAEDYPVDAWDKVMNLNVRSIFLLSQAVGKRSMIPRQYGKIINVASIAGFSGNSPSSPMKTVAYNTSKAAVINFTRTLAGEWGVHGITVNAIAPGFFPSKMTKGLLEKAGEGAIAQRAPLQRIGDDEDLKGIAALFATDASKHITGQVMAVDGGVSAVH
ncbi:SDR family oxidoreductase [Noviherbaspirillum galbum]|uniref:SDR family oxidoreductase n=1 Tax=Noviherbaspirillum galbum TaxID=2709383 RepID=A0A6B3SFP4_9BURK|nr:SDR family oxidoreductase [Noviherbaspirillum galbum]NEX59717.1 SDR family oxidoreductase [Noviherbaspirillum galbum]